MIKSKGKIFIIISTFLFSLFSIFIFNMKVIDDITTGFGWPLRFLLYFNPYGSKDIFYVLQNFKITSINFKIELYILNSLLYYLTVLWLYKIIEKLNSKFKKKPS